jgi:hypothetical protein
VTGVITSGGLTGGVTLYATQPTDTPVALTFRLPQPSGAGLPEGIGYGAIKMPAGSAAAIFAGKLGDGAAISFGGNIVIDGASKLPGIPVYISLYNGKGSIAGMLTRETTINGDLDGVLAWIKPPTAGPFFPAGFTANVSLYGSLYVKPQPGGQVIPLTSGTVSFTGGGIENPPLEKLVTLTPNNKIVVVYPGPDKLRMSINISNGLFSGSVVGPAAPKATHFSGALFQAGQGFGSGVFRGPAAPGSVGLQ